MAKRSRHGLLAALGSVAVLIPFNIAQAASVDRAGASSCQVRGFSIDKDKNGTNIRSAPRANAPIIGHLPGQTAVTPDDTEGAEFDIIGSRDNWLLIRNVDAGSKDTATDKAFEGDGWISARLVGTQLRAPAFRSGPRKEAPAIADLLEPASGPDSVAVKQVHGCSGRYLEVTIAHHGKMLRGWSFAPCSSQLTTCDGGLQE